MGKLEWRRDGEWGPTYGRRSWPSSQNRYLWYYLRARFWEGDYFKTSHTQDELVPRLHVAYLHMTGGVIMAILTFVVLWSITFLTCATQMTLGSCSALWVIL